MGTLATTCRQLLEKWLHGARNCPLLDKAPDLDMEFVEADVLEKQGWDKTLNGAVGLFHLATIYATSGDGQLILDTIIKAQRMS